VGVGKTMWGYVCFLFRKQICIFKIIVATNNKRIEDVDSQQCPVGESQVSNISVMIFSRREFFYKQL
jgi:hypothetical protein